MGGLLNWTGPLTALLLVAVILAEFTDVMNFTNLSHGWRAALRAALFLSGVAWGCSAAAALTGLPALKWGIPILYLGVGLPWLKKRLRARSQRQRESKESGVWRCGKCQADNAAVNAVCRECRTPRGSSHDN